jgi:hypothetical protein
MQPYGIQVINETRTEDEKWEWYYKSKSHSPQHSICQECKQNYYYDGMPHCNVWDYTDQFVIAGRGLVLIMFFPNINEKGIPFKVGTTIKVKTYGEVIVCGFEMMRGIQINPYVGVLVRAKK